MRRSSRHGRARWRAAMPVFNGLVLCATILLAGCATVLSGRDQSIHVQTDPPGALVRANGRDVGVSPAEFKINRSERRVLLEISKAGHRTQEVQIQATWNRQILLGFLLGAGVPLLVDWATGAMWTLKPDKIDVWLDEAWAPKKRDSPEAPAQNP